MIRSFTVALLAAVGFALSAAERPDILITDFESATYADG